MFKYILYIKNGGCFLCGCLGGGGGGIGVGVGFGDQGELRVGLSPLLQSSGYLQSQSKYMYLSFEN